MLATVALLDCVTRQTNYFARVSLFFFSLSLSPGVWRGWVIVLSQIRSARPTNVNPPYERPPPDPAVEMESLLASAVTKHDYDNTN